MHDFSYITRSSEPSKLDTAEYGTLCKVITNYETSYYIQLSSDAETPKWALLESKDENELINKINELKLKTSA